MLLNWFSYKKICNKIYILIPVLDILFIEVLNEFPLQFVLYRVDSL